MLLLGDFYEHMMELPENSVNAILTDPPYGTTKNKWDNAFDIDKWGILLPQDRKHICRRNLGKSR